MLRLFAIVATMTASLVSGQDMTSCPSGMVLASDGRCVCPAGTTMTSTGSCAPTNACPYTYGTMCVDVCPPNTLMYGTTCMDSCPAPLVAMPPYCVQMSPDQMCAINLPGSVADPVSMGCVCPQGQWMVRDWNVTNRLASRCIPISATSSITGTLPPKIGCHTYIRNTTYVPTPLDTCQCVRELPVIVPNLADKFLPFACAPAGTFSQILPCPSNMYFEFMARQCVNITMPSPSMSPSVRPSFSATMTATPSSEPTMSPSITAKTNTSSGGGFVQPPMPTPSAAPTQRVISEPSPSATLTPKDSTTGDGSFQTATSSMSQRPVEPTTTQTPKDTRPDVGASADPTKRSVEPSATQTPRPLPTADLVWIGNVIRTILPSFAPTKLPPVRMTAMPSPWRPTRNITIALEDRPPYIASQIKFAGVNVSAFQSIDKFQEIQMSLACTLRVALEKIRLTNITITDIRGLKTIIDASQSLLSSNGTIACFKLERNASNIISRTGLRRLQAALNSEAQIDYYIVEPPMEILALTPAEFSSVMESSAVMSELSASVGSTGVTVASESSLAASGSSPSSGPTSQSAPSNSAMVGGVIAGAVLGVAVVSALVGVGFMRKRAAAAQASNLTHRVSTSGSVSVVHLNPIPSNPRYSPPQHQTWLRMPSQRNPVSFEAQKARTSV